MNDIDIDREVRRLEAEDRREIEVLAGQEFLVETNQGTYGSAEAARRVGTGDPRFADRNVYETVGGSRRETGPSEDDAPGRMRRINAKALRKARERLARLRRSL